MFDTNMYGKRFVLRTFALYFPRLLPINDVQKLYQVIRWTVVRKRSPKYVPLHSIKSFGNIQTYYPNRYSSIRSFVQKHVGSKQKFFQWGTLTETYGNHRKPRYSSGWWDSKIGSIQASIMKTTAIKHTYVGFGPKVGSLQSLHLFRKHLKYWFWRACRYVPVRSKMLNNGKSLSGIHLEHATTVQSPNLFYQQPFLCSCRGLQFEGLVRPITQVKPSGGWGGVALEQLRQHVSKFINFWWLRSVIPQNTKRHLPNFPMPWSSSHLWAFRMVNEKNPIRSSTFAGVRLSDLHRSQAI